MPGRVLSSLSSQYSRPNCWLCSPSRLALWLNVLLEPDSLGGDLCNGIVTASALPDCPENGVQPGSSAVACDSCSMNKKLPLAPPRSSFHVALCPTTLLPVMPMTLPLAPFSASGAKGRHRFLLQWPELNIWGTAFWLRLRVCFSGSCGRVLFPSHRAKTFWLLLT